MVIYAISGSGIGAGKTTLANKLVPPNAVWSLASALRQELYQILPGYDWNNKSQKYKDSTLVKERRLKTVRDVMVEHGQIRCADDRLYWVRKLVDRLDPKQYVLQQHQAIAIDDVRKLYEIEYLKEKFHGKVVHLHVVSDKSIDEPQFDSKDLRDCADYIIMWPIIPSAK